MVEIEQIDATIRATDRVGNVLEVETVGWDEATATHSFPYQVDAVTTGRATELRTTADYPSLARMDGDESIDQTLLEPDALPMVCEGSYMVDAEGTITALVRFDGSATIDLVGNGVVAITFEHPTVVSIAFMSRVMYPRQTITVPRTTEGVAVAVSQLSASLRETDSQRSANPDRRHPPRMQFGDEVDVPAEVCDHVPETGLEFRLPPRRDLLFQIAPLAYYLAAQIELDADRPPQLRASDGSFRHEFAPPPQFQYDVAALLRRVFHLETVVRYETIGKARPTDVDLLGLVDLDPTTIDDRSHVDRLRRYLDVGFERISPALPEWHFVSYVEPTFENARALPYLVRYLGAIFHPDAAPGRAGSAHDAWRRVPETVPRRVVDGGPHGSAIAWMAPGLPPRETMFAPTPDGFEHSPGYLGRTDGAETVVVVCNEPSRRDDRDAAVEHYRRHGPRSIEVVVEDDVSRAELTAIFERGPEFVHFIGACADGLACPDGVVDPAAFDRSNVRLFFFDGADSVDVGRQCLRRGSAGGLVRTGTEDALDPAVRDNLLGLLTTGFTLDQATRYAAVGRGGDDLLAVGDAFAQLTRSMKLYCVPATVERIGTDRFLVEAYPYIPETGFVWRPGVERVESKLCARPFRFTASGPELARVVDAGTLVVVSEDATHWNAEREPFSPFV